MNKRLAGLLSGTLPPEVYRFTSDATASSLLDQAHAAGWRPFYLDGSAIASKPEFLRACAQAMAFPGHFGNNWDALLDSLRDLSWSPTRAGYLVLYDGAGHFANAHPADFATAVDIFHSACDFWRPAETPMAVLLRGAGRTVSGVPKL